MCDEKSVGVAYETDAFIPTSRAHARLRLSWCLSCNGRGFHASPFNLSAHQGCPRRGRGTTCVPSDSENLGQLASSSKHLSDPHRSPHVLFSVHFNLISSEFRQEHGLSFLDGHRHALSIAAVPSWSDGQHASFVGARCDAFRQQHASCAFGLRQDLLHEHAIQQRHQLTRRHRRLVGHAHCSRHTCLVPCHPEDRDATAKISIQSSRSPKDWYGLPVDDPWRLLEPYVGSVGGASRGRFSIKNAFLSGRFDPIDGRFKRETIRGSWKTPPVQTSVPMAGGDVVVHGMATRHVELFVRLDRQISSLGWWIHSARTS